jgi:quinol monooxygenase YgiN
VGDRVEPVRDGRGWPRRATRPARRSHSSLRLDHIDHAGNTTGELDELKAALDAAYLAREGQASPAWTTLDLRTLKARNPVMETAGIEPAYRVDLPTWSPLSYLGGSMSQPLVYVDESQVEAGKLAPLKAAIKELAEFTEENEPGLVSYSVYFDEHGSQMTVVHIHADSASLDLHMDVARPLFQRFTDFVTLKSIHIYGEPSETALERLRDKMRLLGTGEVKVHAPYAGFLRTAFDDGVRAS